MDATEGIAGLVERYRVLRLHQDQSMEIITELLLHTQRLVTEAKGRNDQLARDLYVAQLDLEKADKSKQEAQLELVRLKSDMGANMANSGHSQKHNPYVVVLIDGNGLLFKDHFVRRGVEGGRKAAHALKAAILGKCFGLATEIEVIAKVYVDLSGLAQRMQRGSVVDKESDLRDLSFGFTRAVASFDFVDVGSVSSDAFLKIRESTIWHLKNHNCQHVILGISHDDSSTPFLRELIQDFGQGHRVTVLEGAHTVPELVATGASFLSLNDTIFRTQRLAYESPAGDPVLPEPLSSPLTSPKSTSVTTVSRPGSTPVVEPVSYARVIKKSATPPPKMTLPIPLQPKASSNGRQASQPSKSAQPPWNPGPRGLDPPLMVTADALERIKKRKDHNKLCNNHYLRGPCSKGDECCFEHKYKPTPEEIVAIAFLTRQNPCTSGQACDVENCIYGHHCPTTRDGVCSHSYCNFGVKDHPPGTKLLRKASQGYEDY